MCTCRHMNKHVYDCEVNMVPCACVWTRAKKPVIICEDRGHRMVIFTNDDDPQHSQCGMSWTPYRSRKGHALSNNESARTMSIIEVVNNLKGGARKPCGTRLPTLPKVIGRVILECPKCCDAHVTLVGN